jgi:RNA polymerase sigma-70 factor (ECF subfamily)
VDTNIDEQNLIKKAQKDISYFKLLYERYIKVVYRYAYFRLGKNKELTEDVVSETFVKAIEKFNSFHYQKKPFVVWLYTIAHNLIVDHYRDKEEKTISFDSLKISPTEHQEDFLESLSREEMKEIVQHKLQELPDEIKNLFTLHYTEDLTFAQIGALIGKNEGAVKMQYYRALEYIKSKFMIQNEL